MEEGSDRSKRGSEGGDAPVGIETTEDAQPLGPRKLIKKRVTFKEGDATGTEVGSPRHMPSHTPTRPSSSETDFEGAQPLSLGNSDHLVSVWERDWGAAYLSCPTWSERYQKTRSTTGWPIGVKIFKGQMFLEEKLCIPMSFQNEVIHENHEFLGHVGSERTWKHICLRYSWSDERKAQQFCQGICKKCTICQASSRGEIMKGPIESTPIPPSPMASVAIDLFKMPEVLYEGGEVQHNGSLRGSTFWLGNSGTVF